MTPHPDERWMMQIARNVTMADWGFLAPGHHLIHDRDGKYCRAFQRLIEEAGVTCLVLPPRSPNLNAYAERWVRSVKEECLSRIVLFGERALRHTLKQYEAHYHAERPPSRQRQCHPAAVSTRAGMSWSGSMLRTTRWAPQVRPP
jgi:transposase InsO family protein